MSVIDQINRIKNAKQSIKEYIIEKGVQVGDEHIDEYRPLLDSIQSGEGSAIVNKPDGWQGTTIPDSGEVGKIYFNTNLSTEEVLEIINTLNFVPYDGIEIWSCFTDETMENSVLIMYMGLSYNIRILTQGNVLDVFLPDSGWAKNFDGVFEFDVPNMLSTIGPMLNFTPENEKANKLFSLEPFTIAQKQIKLTGEYAGDTVTVDFSNKIVPCEGTAVPETGLIEKIYLNTKLSIDEVLSIIETLNFVPYNTGTDIWSCMTDLTMSNAVVILRIATDGAYTYMIQTLADGFSSTVFYGNSGTNDGWAENFSGLYECHVENMIVTVGSTLGFTPENEKAKDLFSSTPFEKLETNIKPVINMEEFIENKQLPLTINVKGAGGGVTLFEDGAWIGTSIPTEGLVEKIYFNTKLSPEEVVAICDSLTFTTYENAEIWACFTDETMENSISILKYTSNQKKYYYINVRYNGDSTDAFFGDPDNSEYGWRKGFSGAVPVNMENKLSIVAPMLNFTPENEKAKFLFSITPFENEKVQLPTTLSGEYNASPIKYSVYNKWYGTTVPQSGFVENLYFNTELSISEVEAKLKEMIERNDVMTTILASFSYEEKDLVIVCYNELDKRKIYICEKNSSYGVVTFWDSEIGWNEENVNSYNLTNLTLSSEEVTQVPEELHLNRNPGVFNYYIPEIFSTTPFVNENTTTINVEQFLDEMKLPLSYKLEIDDSILGAMKPAGSIILQQNGVYDVERYDSVYVEVPMINGSSAVITSKEGNVNINGTYDGSPVYVDDLEINLKQYIDNKKIPLKIDINKDYIIPKGNITITKNGTHDVREYENVSVAISSGDDSSLVFVKTPIGWEGTTIPTSGYLDKIYINTKLSKEEVNTICDTFNFIYNSDISGGSDIAIWSCATDTEITNGIIIWRWINADNKKYYEIGVSKNGTNQVIFNSDDGWTSADSNILEFGMDNQLYMVGPYLGFTPENEKASGLFSSEPFTPVMEDTILTGDYDGSAVVMNRLPKDKYKPGTPIPDSGVMDTIYINSTLSIQEIVDICKTLTFVPYNDTYIWSCFTDSQMTNAIVINKYGDDKYSILIRYYNSDISIFDTNVGWNDDWFIDGLSEFKGKENQLSVIGPTLGLTPENEKATLLFSYTPFEKVGGDNTIDLKEYIKNQKLPLEFKINNEYVIPEGELSIDTLGYHTVAGYKKVYVSVPNGYVKPSGTKTITTNGIYDVKNYANVDVKKAEEIPEGYIKPSGNIDITTTETIDVAQYATAKIFDEDLKPENIAEDISIFGVVGTHKGGNDTFKEKILDGTLEVCTSDEVKKITEYRFYNFSSLTKVSFPKCSEIGSSAFYNCYSLTEASLPECEEISVDAFRYCNSLATISFPNCTYIGNAAFYACRSLTEANFPNCTYIENDAFRYCNSLTEASFPNCSEIGSSAFNACHSLTEISFPECKTIGSNAFQTCYSLTKASFPNCENIGEDAFYRCSSLTEANFPECKIIDSYAFDECNFLTEISFPECKTIYSYAFYRCSSLTKASFPKCSYIGYSAFYACNSLTEVNFPECKEMENYAFAYCGSLTKASFPECSRIYYGAFMNCSSLATISFPNCIYIGSSAFSTCYSLTKASFPKCSEIGEDAFYKCSSLTEANFPECGYIGYSAFQYCENLKTLIFLGMKGTLRGANAFYSTPLYDSTYLGYYGSIYVPSAAVETLKTSTNWVVYSDRITALPSEYDEKYIYGHEFYSSNITSIPKNKQNVEYILRNAFYSCHFLTEASFPNCSYIGYSAFNDCHSLATINFPKCEDIREYAFADCSSLTTISFPECSRIYYGAFMNCSSLATISFPNCIYIGSSAFNSCYSLTEANFPNCTYIGNSAFSACRSLTEANFPNCSGIGTNTFAYCGSLARISFPECKIIGYYAFYSCSSLTKASFPECSRIGYSAFLACNHLATISFPICTYIGNSAFNSCHSLTEASFPKCSEIGNDAFVYCSSLTEASFPECEDIGDEAFAYCGSLARISFPECKIIGSYAFYSCHSLTEASFPECSRIGYSAFQYCEKMSKIYFNVKSVPRLLSGYAFAYTPLSNSSYLGYYGSIYVPISLYEKFKTEDGWVYYADRIVAMDFDE